MRDVYTYRVCGTYKEVRKSIKNNNNIFRRLHENKIESLSGAAARTGVLRK